MLIFLGVVLLVVAVGLAVPTWRQLHMLSTLRRAGEATPGELVNSAQDHPVQGRPGQGSQRRRAVVGHGFPGHRGIIGSAVNQEQCIWHGHNISPSRLRQRANPPANPAAPDHLAALNHQGHPNRPAGGPAPTDGVWSSEPFFLVGPDHQIEVHPAGMRIDQPERRPSRTFPAGPPRPGGTYHANGSGPTTMYHREWIIRVGTPLYVLGEVTTYQGRLVIKRPAKGMHLISTRTARQLLRQTQTRALLTGVPAAVAALAGLVTLLSGFG